LRGSREVVQVADFLPRWVKRRGIDVFRWPSCKIAQNSTFAIGQCKRAEDEVPTRFRGEGTGRNGTTINTFGGLVLGRRAGRMDAAYL
jgi:hypothetical protein